jgi:hypothetical protein
VRLKNLCNEYLYEVLIIFILCAGIASCAKLAIAEPVQKPSNTLEIDKPVLSPLKKETLWTDEAIKRFIENSNASAAQEYKQWQQRVETIRPKQ